MADKETNIGKSALNGQPNKPLSFIIADNSVSTPKLQDQAVTPEKLSPSVQSSVIQPMLDESEVKLRQQMEEDKQELQNNIDSINRTLTNAISQLRSDTNADIHNLDEKYKQITDTLYDMIKSIAEGGIALKQDFGDEKYFGISQKTLTDAVNRLWSKIEDMTGENLRDFQMKVTPNYFISEDGCTIHVVANTVETEGVFEEIKFFINGTQVWPEQGHEEEGKNVDYVEFDTTITETSVIKCEAKIVGNVFTHQEIITHYNSFLLGAGNTYQDMLIDGTHFDPKYVIPIENGMRGAYDVTVADNQHIIVAVGENLAQGFIRADMNGFEIPFVESTATVDGKVYKVFTSENAYQAGVYNIDING